MICCCIQSNGCDDQFQTFSGEFVLVKFKVYCIDVALRDLVHDVETASIIHGLW